MRYVTAAQMKEIDRAAIERGGVGAAQLMENAGRAVADEAGKIIKKGTVFVFSGYGNNGGDGFVAARRLIKSGYRVKVFLVGKPRPFSAESQSNFDSLLKLQSRPEKISSEAELSKIFSKEGSGTFWRPDLIIDAVFGIGLRGGLEDFYIKLIENINSIGAPIISVDLPSGLDSDTGKPVGAAVRASRTVTLGYPKIGFKSSGAKKHIGELIIADIGLSAARYKVVRLRKGNAGRVRPGHPWIYKAQILKVESSMKAGDIVRIETAEGRFIGNGYCNPKSEISLRVLSFSDKRIDGDFFDKRIGAAVEKRKDLLAVTNTYRAVFSEADGLPGLIVDVYADTAVFQVLTLGMDRLKNMLVQSMKEILKPRYVYEKSDSVFRKLEGLKNEDRWWGEKGKDIVEIFEGGSRFLVDIVNGHKTGFYLDQRKSRMGLEGISKGKRVLDLFCYTGGFAVNAAIAGAEYARGVDIKEEWLGLGRKNTALNGVAERVEFVRGDAFDVLRNIYNSGEKFGIIIIDPPSFLKRRGSLAAASKGYKDLNLIAMKTLVEGGVLATFSCSHNMPNEAFSDILKRAARDAGKKITILRRCHQAQDHPVVKAIPETEYLKGYFLKVESAPVA